MMAIHAHPDDECFSDPFEQREREAREKALAEGKSFDEILRASVRVGPHCGATKNQHYV